MIPMEIFELGESRLSQVIGLIKEVYEENHSALYFEKKPSDDYLEHMLRSKIEMALEKRAIDIVAVDGGKLLGECEIILDKDIGKVGILVGIESRRRKVGTTLLEEALKRAKKLGMARVYAEVNSNNSPAIEFFVKHGFAWADERKNVHGALKLLMLDL